MIEANTSPERELLAEIARLGLTIHMLRAAGSAVRVFGPGVWVTASSLGALTLNDLRPVDTKEALRSQAFLRTAKRG